MASSGAVSFARNDENLLFCLSEPTVPLSFQLLLIIAMCSVITDAVDNKDSHMALAAALKLERALFTIFLQ